MTDEQITQYIDMAVDTAVKKTVTSLRINKVLKDDQKTGIEKIEGLLRYYPLAKNLKNDDYAQRIVRQIDAALEAIQDDLYYNIIPMTYFNGELRETIAGEFNTSVTTISRNKKRLLIELEKRITPSDFIIDLLAI